MQVFSNIPAPKDGVEVIILALDASRTKLTFAGVFVPEDI
jgi:hypothetical protein